MKHAPTVLSVSHRTTYHYSTYVETAQHLATIRPIACSWQRVISHEERIEPAPSYLNSRIDAFGNDVLYFALDAPHERLQLVSETMVSLTPRWTDLDPDTTPAWDDVADALQFRVGGQFRAEVEFCFASPNIVLWPALREYALPSFPSHRPIAAGAIDLMHRIHADFAYKASATMFDTPAERAFELKSGVCQDFAQVMIGCLRSLGLPARYVSGYLRNDPPPGQPRLIGADASHAWVSVHCPGSGWIDLDPTNDMLADVDHVTLAIGRDYSDVSLLRGMILGGGAHRVEVGVTVLAL
ncbi:Transglutaminase-like enzyme, predicted cysteine protease [Paraburkholderia ribeironis]|uniref:Transglutaminase-like enzyme, predicted cysteine protease n=1 Tax=Paraburkholderia ribeironis TaxID=1247936 RepID=A0A1N7SB83_9BURK|nr:transglutaminase family protein [Paraburkholderia ribeironis]SIT44591.1 Transglutaminase-like enzyme, predicted cysteine protease [Paraburkholderia ribeironis]